MGFIDYNYRQHYEEYARAQYVTKFRNKEQQKRWNQSRNPERHTRW